MSEKITVFRAKSLKIETALVAQAIRDHIRIAEIPTPETANGIRGILEALLRYGLREFYRLTVVWIAAYDHYTAIDPDLDLVWSDADSDRWLSVAAALDYVEYQLFLSVARAAPNDTWLDDNFVPDRS